MNPARACARVACAAILICAAGPATLAAQCDTATFESGFCSRFEAAFPGGEVLEFRFEVPSPDGWQSQSFPGLGVHLGNDRCRAAHRVHAVLTTAVGDVYTCRFEGDAPILSVFILDERLDRLWDVGLEHGAIYRCTLNGGPEFMADILAAFRGRASPGTPMFSDLADPATVDWNAADVREEATWVGPGLEFPAPGVPFRTGPCIPDEDGDGVADPDDRCPGTAPSDPAAGVPSVELLPNHYADLDGDGLFEMGDPRGGGQGAPLLLSLEDTAGCNCAQIIERMGVGRGHVRHGCSRGLMLQHLK